MKTQHQKALVYLLSAIFLSSCGGGSDRTQLDKAGINTGIDTTPEDVIFDIGDAGYRRNVRIIDRQENQPDTITYVHEKTNTKADRQINLLSLPVVGMSLNANATIKITGVWDVTNSIYDPKIVSALAKLENIAESEVYFWYSQQTSETLEAINVSEIEGEFKGINLVPQDILEETIFKYALHQTPSISDGSLEGTAADPTHEAGTLEPSSRVEAIFDLHDDHWNKVFRATLDVGGIESEFILSTVERDALQVAQRNFLGNDIINVTPGSKVQSEGFYFSGFNTRLPVKIIHKEPANFNLKYSIDSKAFLPVDLNESFTILHGESVTFEIETEENTFNSAYTFDVQVGEEEPRTDRAPRLSSDSITFTTHAEDYISGPIVHVDFPPAFSNTIANAVTVRGTIEIPENILEYADETTPEELTITEIKVINRSREDQKSEDESNEGEDLAINQLIPLARRQVNYDGKTFTLNTYEFYARTNLVSEENALEITAISNFKTASRENIPSDMLTLNILHTASEADIQSFPTDDIILPKLTDVVVDGSSSNLKLIFASEVIQEDPFFGNHGILWSQPLTRPAAPICRARIGLAQPYHRLTGLQYNHDSDNLRGLSITAIQPSLKYISEAQLKELDSDSIARLDGETSFEGPQYPRSPAITKDGTRIYLSSQSNWQVQPQQQAFISEMVIRPRANSTPKLVSVAANAVVAKETTDTEDGNNEINNGFVIDIFSTPKRNENGTVLIDNQGFTIYDEFVLSLDGQFNGFSTNRNENANRNNDGDMYLRYMPVLPIGEDYSPESSHAKINLYTIEDGTNVPLTLYKANALAADDKNHFAYVADNNGESIWKIDLTPLTQYEGDRPVAIEIDLFAEKIANKNEALFSPFSEVDTADNLENPALNQLSFKNVSSMTIDPGVNYILATDKSHAAVMAIDPVTGERVFIVKGSNDTPNDSQGRPINICN